MLRLNLQHQKVTSVAGDVRLLVAAAAAGLAPRDTDASRLAEVAAAVDGAGRHVSVDLDADGNIADTLGSEGETPFEATTNTTRHLIITNRAANVHVYLTFDYGADGVTITEVSLDGYLTPGRLGLMPALEAYAERDNTARCAVTLEVGEHDAGNPAQKSSEARLTDVIIAGKFMHAAALAFERKLGLRPEDRAGSAASPEELAEEIAFGLNASARFMTVCTLNAADIRDTRPGLLVGGQRGASYEVAIRERC